MLPSSTRGLIGRLLEITPVYGWGWSRLDEGVRPMDYSAVLAAGPFRARLERPWEWRGELRGGVAQVEKAGHPFDQQWVVFWTMRAGTWELNGGPPPRVDVEIGPEPPVSPNDWPHLVTGARRLRGHVSIRPLREGATSDNNRELNSVHLPSGLPARSLWADRRDAEITVVAGDRLNQSVVLEFDVVHHQVRSRGGDRRVSYLSRELLTTRSLAACSKSLRPRQPLLLRIAC